MRIGVVLVGFVSLIASMYGVAWLLRDNPRPTIQSQNPTPETKTPSDAKTDDDHDDHDGHDHAKGDDEAPDPANRPKVVTSGPLPKAVIEEMTFNFGRMEVGEERKHTFVIRNEGQGELKVVKGPTTCQCTVSDVKNGSVAPGESAEITLTWKPSVETDEFSKGAEIWTNDAALETISLKIEGMVATRLILFPASTWSLTEFHEDEPTEIGGVIASPIVENFTVTSVESGQSFIKASAVKIEDPQKLAAFKALCAYQIKVEVLPDIPIGGFSFPLTIKTDLVGQTGEPIERTVIVRGNRKGPLRILGKGNQWNQDLGAVVLGGFNASEGKKVTLTVIALQAPPEGLKVVESEIVCDPSILKVQLVPDGTLKSGVGRYLLSFEYPAGSPRVVRREEDPGRVKIRTNHPKAPELEFLVYFNAY